MVRELDAKSVLYYHDRTFATNWDANIYRGCGHRCVYCFAMYSHKYLEADFFDDIFVKRNAAGVLLREFRKKSWRGEPVCIAGVSDAYQPAEAECCVVPDVLHSFIAARNPIALSTKSTLALRDIDLFRELAKVADVSIAVSISTLNEDYRRLLEPFASPARARLEMLREFKKAGCHVGVLFMPIIPFISDGDADLDEVFRLSADVGVDYICTYPLHLRSRNKAAFFSFISDNFPHLLAPLQSLYKDRYVSKEYSSALKEKIRLLRRKYSLKDDYVQPSRPVEPQQLTLF